MELHNTITDLERQIITLKEENSRFNSTEKDTSEKMEETYQSVKAQYNKTIQQLENEKKSLEEALKLANDGKVDESIKTQLIEAENNVAKILKLEKQIKELEDDIEDAKNEQEELRKKYNAKLQKERDKLDDLTSKNEQLQDDFKRTKDELTNHKKELNRKSKSIGLIQEILSAPKTGAKEIQKLYRAIDTFESFLKGPFLDCYSYLFEKHVFDV